MERRIQVTLTVAEAKWLIAKGIAVLPEVKKALQEGRIFLKGGTTVSAVAEELAGIPLKISGRFSPRGARAGLHREIKGHSVLITKGEVQIADEMLRETVETLKQNDIVIIGANAIDIEGDAAMCMGAALGGPPGEVLTGLMGNGAKVIITAGLEKLIPGRIRDAIMASGRNAIQEAHGMAVGLIPLVGRVFTEKDAITALANVTCTVIAMGGIDGAEGATTMVIAGEASEVAKVVCVINQVKGSLVSGIAETLGECEPCGPGCGLHKACIYRSQRNSLS